MLACGIKRHSAIGERFIELPFVSSRGGGACGLAFLGGAAGEEGEGRMAGLDDSSALVGGRGNGHAA